MRLCIYGASSSEIDESYNKRTYDLAQKLGKKGYGMVYGGGAKGLMGASARGMRSVDAEIIGVAPTFFMVDGVLYDECTEFIYTETMRERKQIMEEKADGFIVLPGGFGTYEEFFEIYTAKQLARHNKPIVVYNINGYYDKMKELFHHTIDNGFAKEASMKLVLFTDNDEEVIDYFEKYNINDVITTEKLKYINDK